MSANGYVSSNQSNPFLTQYAQQMSGWSGDPYAAYMAQNSTQANVLSNQQQTILGNGGYGYIAGGGNDQGGSSYGNSLQPNTSGWSAGVGGNGGYFDPSSAYTPGNAQQAGYNGLGVVAPGTQYLNSAQANAAAALSAQGGNPGYFEGQTWVPTPNASSTTNTANLNSPASSYPTYANQYNLGSGTGNSGASSGGAAAGTAMSASAPATPSAAVAAPQAQQQSFQVSSPTFGSSNSAVNVPQNSQTPLNATTGFNPWSLTGEANSVKA